MKNPKAEGERWLRQAEYDLRVGVPAEFYDEDATEAIALASEVIEAVKESLEESS